MCYDNMNTHEFVNLENLIDLIKKGISGFLLFSGVENLRMMYLEFFGCINNRQKLCSNFVLFFKNWNFTILSQHFPFFVNVVKLLSKKQFCQKNSILSKKILIVSKKIIFNFLKNNSVLSRFSIFNENGQKGFILSQFFNVVKMNFFFKNN